MPRERKGLIVFYAIGGYVLVMLVFYGLLLGVPALIAAREERAMQACESDAQRHPGGDPFIVFSDDGRAAEVNARARPAPVPWPAPLMPSWWYEWFVNEAPPRKPHSRAPTLPDLDFCSSLPRGAAGQILRPIRGSRSNRGY